MLSYKMVDGIYRVISKTLVCSKCSQEFDRDSTAHISMICRSITTYQHLSCLNDKKQTKGEES